MKSTLFNQECHLLLASTTTSNITGIYVSFGIQSSKKENSYGKDNKVNYLIAEKIICSSDSWQQFFILEIRVCMYIYIHILNTQVNNM